VNNLSKLDRTTLAEATPPVITCPQSYTVTANLSKCTASISLTGNFGATATGTPTPSIEYYVNGSIIPTTYIFPKGITKVTAIASNGVLPNASCTFTVTVVCGPVTSSSPTTSATMEVTGEVKQEGLRLYPNPATHFLNVQWTTSTTSKSIIRILNAEGKTVRTIASPTDIFKQRISLNGLAKGIYMLVLTNDEKQQVSKFVIQ
jgi:hypothetical protein